LSRRRVETTGAARKGPQNMLATILIIVVVLLLVGRI